MTFTLALWAFHPRDTRNRVAFLQLHHFAFLRRALAPGQVGDARAQHMPTRRDERHIVVLIHDARRRDDARARGIASERRDAFGVTILHGVLFDGRALAVPFRRDDEQKAIGLHRIH